MPDVSGTTGDTLTVAYFSMEFGIDPAIPTYSGGLGILAGDTLCTAADLELHAVGVTLMYRKGYFRQHLDKDGNQSESEYAWSPESLMELLPNRIIVTLSGRQVQVQAWLYLVRGESGHTVPVFFLDTAIPENSVFDQGLTDHLYNGDGYYRLCQEAVLGLGGVAMLRALGYHHIRTYHMNEGHSALIALALLEERVWGRGLLAVDDEDREMVRQCCVFTTHTPVPSGHDVFPTELVRQVLGNERTDFLVKARYCCDGVLSMTELALKSARYINGVSMRHEEVCRTFLANSPIDSVTNGVHAATWTSPPFQCLYDDCLTYWRQDNLVLRQAIGIPLEEIWGAHIKAKEGLLFEVERRTGVKLNPAIMTIGFARRATPYKRIDLLFHDLERLKQIARQAGPIQVVCGGKAHPRDEGGKALIRRIFQAANALKGIIPVVYLEEYDIALAKYLCSGVDLWLNTPQKPLEASGTSGMKAALNGVPSLSVLDGWWLEGHVEGVTGWSVGDGCQPETDSHVEAASLYGKLEHLILPMFYWRWHDFVKIMRSTIALNGSFFNSQRMLSQYLQKAYLVPQGIGSPEEYLSVRK